MEVDNEDKGLLTKLIKGYSDKRIQIVKKLAKSNSDTLLQENPYYDQGYLNSMVRNLKKSFTSISDEIQMITKTYSKKELDNDKFKKLLQEKDQIRYDIAFMSSNRFNNLDYSLQLLDGIKTDFKKCIYALKEYQKGNHHQAFRYFHEYLKTKNYILEHFLINKVYGSLLLEVKQYHQAKLCFTKAVQLRPGDLEVHQLLAQVHDLLDEQREKQVELDIINLLEV